MKTIRSVFTAALLFTAEFAHAGEPLSMAVFDFETKEDSAKELGGKAATLINAYLSADPLVITVERTDLQKLLGEQELGLSGNVSAATAAKVGQLTGAKVIVTGRIFSVGNELMMVAKVISSETSRVYGEVVKGTSANAIDTMSQEMAKKIGIILDQKGETLVAKVPTHEERVAKLKEALKGKQLPVMHVKIAEQHYGGQIIDPAAETEFGLLLRESGFTLGDAQSTTKVEVELTGEAFSEFGLRKGNLYSCKARVEIKVVEKASGKILWADRQTSVGVDIAERTAAKTALQNAAAQLAERVLPKLGK
ncbi:MAG: curli assembly protein CsgG [Verrucomicrobia bacterium]|jgi:TolB-like protein|nr:curli assembly protein CsgG [Verrucomicrobiota bacterium]